MIVNLSGRGDKDVATAAEWFDLLDKDSPEPRSPKRGNSCEHVDPGTGDARTPANRQRPLTAPRRRAARP